MTFATRARCDRNQCIPLHVADMPEDTRRSKKSAVLLTVIPEDERPCASLTRVNVRVQHVMRQKVSRLTRMNRQSTMNIGVAWSVTRTTTGKMCCAVYGLCVTRFKTKWHSDKTGIVPDTRLGSDLHQRKNRKQQQEPRHKIMVVFRPGS